MCCCHNTNIWPVNVYSKTSSLDKHVTECISSNTLGRNTNKMQLVIEFIILKFNEGSTCFERHTARRQEL